MSFRDYLESKAISLCMGGIGIFYLTLIVWLCGLPLSMLFILLFSGLLFLFLCMVFSWKRAERSLKMLKSRLETMQEKYLIGETLPRPRDSVELQYYLLMQEISRSAIGAVEQAREEKQDYYVRTVCDQAVREEMELLINAGIAVSISGEGHVYTDSKLLIFILKQLLINCAKYCPDCQIHIELGENSLCFEDNGTGIPSHELHRVTERGFSGAAGRKQGQSTGMGLYIVSQLCQSLNIQMEITSLEGAFTRFTFRFICANVLSVRRKKG